MADWQKCKWCGKMYDADKLKGGVNLMGWQDDFCSRKCMSEAESQEKRDNAESSESTAAFNNLPDETWKQFFGRIVDPLKATAIALIGSFFLFRRIFSQISSVLINPIFIGFAIATVVVILGINIVSNVTSKWGSIVNGLYHTVRFALFPIWIIAGLEVLPNLLSFGGVIAFIFCTFYPILSAVWVSITDCVSAVTKTRNIVTTVVSILVGLPLVVFFLVSLGSPDILDSAAEKIESAKAVKEFKKNYKSDWNVITGQQYVHYSVDGKTGELNVDTAVIFDKNGYAFGSDDETYLIDTTAHTITVTWDDETEKYSYTTDGVIIYMYDEDSFTYDVKANAKFNQENATEVIGKTFSGKWTDDCTASITFGKDGKANVKLSNGENGSGSYLASDDANIVVYNHNDKGVWFALTYSDTDKSAAFYRKHITQNKKGKYVMRTEQHTDWKEQ